jgi:hypothetical protein
MWPTLSVGSFYRIWCRGMRAPRRVLLLGVAPGGELLLAIPPRSPRGRWRPWATDRHVIKGVFAG